MHERPLYPSRIEPDPKWFGNVRTIDQKSLEKLRVELKEQLNDPYAFVVNKKKLPMALIQEEPDAAPRVNVLDYEKYEDTFGPKKKRTRAKLGFKSLEELAQQSEAKEKVYDIEKDQSILFAEKQLEKKENRDKKIEAGQSKRIWDELYKVLDSSDVVCIVLDARDPLGTRCSHVENHVRKNCKFKHLVFILNKVDLIPTSVTKKWIQHLSKDSPTIAFHADINRPFGKHSLIRLLRQVNFFKKSLIIFIKIKRL